MSVVRTNVIKYIKKIIFVCMLTFIISILLVPVWMLYQRRQIEITADSIVTVYKIPDEKRNILLYVNNGYYNDENLYFVSRDGLKVDFDKIIDEHIIDIKFHKQDETTLIEVAHATSQGNGYIDLYEVQNNELVILLSDHAVDSNLDFTTETVYESGKLNLYVKNLKESQEMPDIILRGTELVYGSSSPSTLEKELLYQRNAIEKICQWDHSQNQYVLISDSKELLQQIENVYPIQW